MLAVLLASQMEAQSLRLEPGKPIEAELTSGKTHRYAVNLDAGQYMRVLVLRPSIASVMQLSVDGVPGPLLEMNWPGAYQSPEPINWIAKIAGEYRIELAPATLSTQSSKYSITLEMVRGAVPASRGR